MLKLQHIEMLLAVDRAGSIRAASKLLGRTQPAVTKALRQAEADLGVAIFKRATSGVVATEDGKAVLRRAEVIHAEMRKMQEEIDQRRGEGTGRITVTVSPLAANRLIAGTIKRFRKRFPEVDVQIGGGHEPMAFGPVRDGLVDLVIGPEPQGKDVAGLSVAFLLETPVSVITGENSRWRNCTDLAQLVEGDWLMIGTRARLPYFQRNFTLRGLNPPQARVTSESITSVLAMVQDSDFLCAFPELLLDRTLTNWRIRALDIPPIRRARIAITTASDRPATPALRYFCDCVSQEAVNAF
ncbi:LysR substrate-binding domain-containing protein [Frigidibacter oleivorans]|uniref:LysR substrate-binding domain-containing protein n=1 Tax=Frigidibacter oleivorans TaxID=2487129 RepID=UPI000F8DAF95|nr:LysR substrate-binding domain-containing protein [Frigidibacter oleivorans]